jgi:peptidoglycan/xylan/chitin deacetylase (PgdA/CDA1 family)
MTCQRRWFFACLLSAIALVGACKSAAPVTHAHVHAVATATAAIPTPISDQQMHRWLQGCGHGAPPPYPQPIWAGADPDAHKPAPQEVALTFDDGPTSYSTPQVLTALEQAHAPATFFVEGQYAQDYPDLLLREWQDGFVIAMHTWDHPSMDTLGNADLRHQFGDTLAAVHKVIGADACLWLWRPPYAAFNNQVLAMAKSYGLTTINWDSNGADWLEPGVQQIVAGVMKTVAPGAIILLHDGPEHREQTAAAIPLILQALHQNGLTPVTLPRLLADAGFPGIDPGPTGFNSPGTMGSKGQASKNANV